ncbi:MAG: hypothetical protein KDA89_15330 [Planctomycetaceae bacterium]|nr:hypothetical protein [Planctomycetaceae bacterium]
MVTERDEILIQRCVDDELSADQRTELLTRMEESPGGWKQLACTFMEEQLFRRAVPSGTKDVSSPTEFLPGPVPRMESPAAWRKWWYHPATTMVLSACVLILLGVVLSGVPQRPDRGLASVVSRPEPAVTTIDRSNTDVPSNRPSATLVAEDIPYTIHVQHGSGEQQDLPVFQDPAAFVSELVRQQEDRRHRADLPDVSAGDADEAQVRFIRLPVGDGRVLLIPVEEFRRPLLLQ